MTDCDQVDTYKNYFNQLRTREPKKPTDAQYLEAQASEKKSTEEDIIDSVSIATEMTISTGGAGESQYLSGSDVDDQSVSTVQSIDTDTDDLSLHGDDSSDEETRPRKKDSYSSRPNREAFRNPAAVGVRTWNTGGPSQAAVDKAILDAQRAMGPTPPAAVAEVLRLPAVTQKRRIILTSASPCTSATASPVAQKRMVGARVTFAEVGTDHPTGKGRAKSRYKSLF